jgi:hypothetical protein
MCLPALMRLMGHTDIETTLRYVQGLPPGRLSAVCPRRGATHPPPAEVPGVKRWRRPPLQHPLAPAFAPAVESLCTALAPSSPRNYGIVVRSFLVYLGEQCPEVTRLEQLRRDPHVLGWMARMRAQTPPLAATTCIGRPFALRTIFYELAWTNRIAELAHLLEREDIPRMPHMLPRPLAAEQDQLLQQEFFRRNDLGANAFLLIRHTGMRIGKCADLSNDCLRPISTDCWAIHVPIGKFKKDRMVPVDAFIRNLARRLRFFRSFDPVPPDGYLLARPAGKVALVVQLRTRTGSEAPPYPYVFRSSKAMTLHFHGGGSSHSGRSPAYLHKSRQYGRGDSPRQGTLRPSF